MPIAIPRTTLERGWPRLSARGALAAAPASIPNTAVRILPVIVLDLEVYTLDCMLALQTLLLFFIRWGVVEGKRFGRFGWSPQSFYKDTVILCSISMMETPFRFSHRVLS